MFDNGLFAKAETLSGLGRDYDNNKNKLKATDALMLPIRLTKTDKESLKDRDNNSSDQYAMSRADSLYFSS